MLVSNFLLKIPRFTGVLSKLEYTWRIQDGVFFLFYLEMNDFIMTSQPSLKIIYMLGNFLILSNTFLSNLDSAI